MTVAALHKRLASLIAAGHGRKPVLINKRTLTHPLESDGVVLIDVKAVTGPEWIHMADDDGGIKVNADGTESGRVVVILVGHGEPE